MTGTYNDALAWAYFQQKREALQLWHEHLDKKLLKGRLHAHIRQAVDGKKRFEEAMKRNMKLGPHSEAHKLAVRRRGAAIARRTRPGLRTPRPGPATTLTSIRNLRMMA